MEVWFGKTDPQHAANQRGTNSPQPLHHLDSHHQRLVPQGPGGEVQGKDEVPEGHERGDHAEGAGDEVCGGGEEQEEEEDKAEGDPRSREHQVGLQ